MGRGTRGCCLGVRRGGEGVGKWVGGEGGEMGGRGSGWVGVGGGGGGWEREGVGGVGGREGMEVGERARGWEGGITQLIRVLSSIQVISS